MIKNDFFDTKKRKNWKKMNPVLPIIGGIVVVGGLAAFGIEKMSKKEKKTVKCSVPMVVNKALEKLKVYENISNNRQRLKKICHFSELLETMVENCSKTEKFVSMDTLRLAMRRNESLRTLLKEYKKTIAEKRTELNIDKRKGSEEMVRWAARMIKGHGKSCVENIQKKAQRCVLRSYMV
jgi:hypothetical protein